jgi:predicted naringenin-chalcone synthase
MPSKIISLGTALPDTIVHQKDAFTLARDLCCRTERQGRVLEQVYLKSGVQTRSTVLQADVETSQSTNFFQPPDTTFDTGPSTAERMSLYEKQAGPLATTACRAALDASAIGAQQITHLVTVSCTGFFAPGFDLQLFKSLSLNPSVKRTHIGFMGCHGALNALRVANGFCAEDPNNVVLICATELCSMHFQYGWSKELMISNALFADGSAALILTGDRSLAGNSHIFYADATSYVVPDTHETMSWRIGDSGFVMSLANNVPEIIKTNLPDFITNWLEQNALTIDEINGWAVHPGGPRILDAVAESLHLQPDALSASRQILSECGNMSSPTVLFILKRLLSTGVTPPFVILGFGPGLTIEAALIH